MNDQSIIKSQIRLREATLTEIAEVTSKLIFQNIINCKMVMNFINRL